MLKPDNQLGSWLENEPMSMHVSWRAGGKARWFFRPGSVEHFLRFLEEADDSSVYPLGLGSNLLVRDGGWDGVAVCLHHALTAMRWETSVECRNGRGLIFAEAGVPSPKVARLAIQKGLGEAEWLATVPGTVGGALAMNAGCYGFETWSYVRRVAVAIPELGYLELSPEAYAIGYRSVHYQGQPVGHGVPHYFLGAWFDFPDGCQRADETFEESVAAGKERMKALLARRIETQPLNLPNAGSVFRNPHGDFAARLIEQSGLKGYRYGGACVSQKHANFIVNERGEATASDIEAVIEYVQRTVAERAGEHLMPEVRLIGSGAW